MSLEEIYKELEKLENDLTYYENRLESLKSMVLPQATKFDKVLVDGGKKTDNILKYVEIENQQQLGITIKYIKKKIYDLNVLKDREIERLTKYGETIKAVVILREREFKVVYRKGIKTKRHLTWVEIGRKLYCDESTARKWYKLAVKERKRVLS